MEQVCCVGRWKVVLYGEDFSKEKPVIWLHTLGDEGKSIWETVREDCVLACVTNLDWNSDLSPWPAPRAFSQGEDFLGKGQEYMEAFLGEILPKTERFLDYPVTFRGLAGYSMAGLFAAYVMYHTALFQGIASVSGSLWFDGWKEYAMAHKPASSRMKIYLSLGDREHKVRNQRMAAVRANTQELARYWEDFGKVFLTWNPGGHFDQPQERTTKGIRWLCMHRRKDDEF